MAEAHSLLRRQIKRHFGDTPPLELANFLATVDSAYRDFDTDRMMLERSLDLSSHELVAANGEMRAILQAFPDVILRLSAAGVIVDVKMGQAAPLGSTPADLIGTRLQDLPVEEAQPSFESALRQLAVDQAPQSVEFTVGDRDGARIYEARLVALPDQAVAAIIRDITERRKIELALAHSERLFRSLIENSSDVITVLSPAGTIRYQSPTVQRVFGYGPQEQTGKSAFRYLHPADLPRVFGMFTAGIARPDSVMSAEFRWRHKDGSWRWVEATGHNMMHDPVPAGIVINSRDVTRRRAAEEAARGSEQEVHRLNAELEQRVEERTGQLLEANQELEAFAYSVSHDLRAPLRALDGFSRILLRPRAEPLDAEAQGYLGRIQAAGERMGNIIDDLLRLSRLSRTEMVTETVDLTTLAVGVVDDLRQADPERTVSVEIRPGMLAAGDSRLLHVALENLLGNAWKFTRRTPGALIEFDQTEAGVFFVRDNGAGFDMAYADKLFGAFQRLHAATEFEGNGIGLATVQRVMRRHNGVVWAEGAVGEGAAFYFSLGAVTANPSP